MRKIITIIIATILLASLSAKADYTNMNVYDATNEPEQPKTPGLEYRVKAMAGLAKNFGGDFIETTEPGYTIGFQLHYQTPKRVGFELNLDFSKKGGHQVYRYYSRNDENIGLHYDNLHSYYFDIAPAVNYSFYDMQLYFGPYIGLCIASIRESGHQYTSDNYISAFDWGTYYGLRYELFSFMQLDLNLSYGFKNINTPKVLYKDDVFMRNIVYRAGLVFKL